MDLSKKVLIPENIVQMLITRMGNEIKTSLIYKDMAAFFDGLNLNGFAKYFMGEAKGEQHHAKLIQTYLADKQANYKMPVIDYPGNQYANVLDVMKAYVEAEQQTTSDLYDIATAAQQAGDWATVSWLTAPDTDEKGKVSGYALISYQKIELKQANDLQMEVARVTGEGQQEQGIGLNAIDARLMRG